MKKFLVTFLILIFIPIFTACKGNNNDKTVIRFSSWGSKTEYAILKQIIEDYENKNPAVKIEFIHVPENYFRKLHLLYASKTEPDVVFVNNTYAPLYIKADLFEDLSSLNTDNAFFKSATDCFTYNGKLFAIPRDVSGLVIYVNKDIIKFPEKIKSIYDLKKYAKISTTENRFGLNFENNPLFWIYYLEYFGGGILSDDGQKIIFNSEESKKGLEFYSDLINKDGSVPHKSQMSGMTSAQMFINGKITMYLSGRWLVPKFRETVKFDWDIIPFPYDNNSKNLIDASGWAVSKSSKHKKVAFDFVKYLSSKEVSEIFTKSGLITPARTDVANSEIFLSKEQKPKSSHVFIDIMKNSKSTPVNENYAKITDEIINATEPVFNGTKTVNELMNKNFEEKLKKFEI